MNNDEVFARIETLEMALTSAVFEDDRPGFASLSGTLIGTIKDANGFGWEMTLWGLKSVSPKPYDTLKDAQSGLRKAVKTVLASLVDTSMPPAKSEMF